MMTRLCLVLCAWSAVSCAPQPHLSDDLRARDKWVSLFISAQHEGRRFGVDISGTVFQLTAESISVVPGAPNLKWPSFAQVGGDTLWLAGQGRAYYRKLTGGPWSTISLPFKDVLRLYATDAYALVAGDGEFVVVSTSKSTSRFSCDRPAPPVLGARSVWFLQGGSTWQLELNSGSKRRVPQGGIPLLEWQGRLVSLKRDASGNERIQVLDSADGSVLFDDSIATPLDGKYCTSGGNLWYVTHEGSLRVVTPALKPSGIALEHAIFTGLTPIEGGVLLQQRRDGGTQLSVARLGTGTVRVEEWRISKERVIWYATCQVGGTIWLCLQDSGFIAIEAPAGG